MEETTAFYGERMNDAYSGFDSDDVGDFEFLKEEKTEIQLAVRTIFEPDIPTFDVLIPAVGQVRKSGALQCGPGAVVHLHEGDIVSVIDEDEDSIHIEIDGRPVTYKVYREQSFIGTLGIREPDIVSLFIPYTKDVPYDDMPEEADPQLPTVLQITAHDGL